MQLKEIELAKQAALEVLIHNADGPFHHLPRTAGWGYPEPYTRDLLLSILGIAVSENPYLMKSTQRVLETLAENQTPLGHITSLVHDKEDRGSSDSTPLFILGVGIFRRVTGKEDFLQDAVSRAMTWMEYQSPSNRSMVAQQPTTDWRDEQWVLGYGLFVNTLVYSYLRLYGQHSRAERMYKYLNRYTITQGVIHGHVHEGLVVKNKPYYALWSFKVYSSERFDLLGNSLAILSGIASPTRAREMVSWIEEECDALRAQGLLAVDLPPNFFPYMQPQDPDWLPRYTNYNLPGEYHNGGVWPFICAFYIAALVAAQKYKLAEQKLAALTSLIRLARIEKADFGFNEWIKAQDGQPKGQDWQSWSAALYLYAAKCVEAKNTPFFDEIRNSDSFS